MQAAERRGGAMPSVGRVATRLGISLDEGERTAYTAALEQLLADFEALEKRADEIQVGTINTIDEIPQSGTQDADPFDAFITRCHLRETEDGPLRSMRVGLKDNIAVAGVPMTLGSSFLRDFVPREHADVVRSLLAAGGTIVGKLNMDGFSHAAHGFGTGLGDFPRCKNPVNRRRLSGGSSSGSAAAVAGDLVDIAIGGDQGGSVRIPASWCGVVGLKPSRGAISNVGVFGIDQMLDTVGPIARTVVDVQLGFEVMAAPLARASDTRPAERRARLPLRVAMLREGFSPLPTRVDRVIESVLARLSAEGVKVSEVGVPEHADAGVPFRVLVFTGQAVMMMSEGGAHREDQFDNSLVEAITANKSRRNRLPPRVKLSMVLGEVLGEDLWAYYSLARRSCRLYERLYDRALERVDALLMPTVPCVAPVYRRPKDAVEALQRTVIRSQWKSVTDNTAPFNLSGHPAITLPCGNLENMPVGLMLVGHRSCDVELLSLARNLEPLLREEAERK